MKRKIELVYFEGCPNATVARENLAEAIRSGGLQEEWEERDLMDPESPDWAKQHGSPTVTPSPARWHWRLRRVWRPVETITASDAPTGGH